MKFVAIPLILPVLWYILCTERYRSPLKSLLFSSFNMVNSYFYSTVDVVQLRTASFLSELIVMKNEMDKLSRKSVLSYTRSCVISLRMSARVNQR